MPNGAVHKVCYALRGARGSEMRDSLSQGRGSAMRDVKKYNFKHRILISVVLTVGKAGSRVCLLQISDSRLDFSDSKLDFSDSMLEL